MNFLAHLYLSGEKPNMIFGNFVADFLDQKELKSLPKALESGVQLHFFIDKETDRHPEVRKFRKLFFQETSHYAGVLLDVIWDHFLAKNFGRFSTISLEVFLNNKFKVVDDFQTEFPERFRIVYPKMKTGRWLQNYTQKQSIISSFSGLANRSPRFEPFRINAVNVFEYHYNALNAAFPAIIFDLKKKSQQFIQEKLM